MKLLERKSLGDAIKEHGIGKVACWHLEELSESFFDSLSFEEWKDIEWEASISTGKEYLAGRAFTGMLKVASTFKQWHAVFCCAQCNNNKQNELYALEKMFEKAEDFDEYLKVYERAPKENPLRGSSLKKMAELLKPYM